MDDNWVFAGVCVLTFLLLFAWVAIYAGVSDDCKTRGGIVVVDGLNRAICVGAPSK